MFDALAVSLRQVSFRCMFRLTTLPGITFWFHVRFLCGCMNSFRFSFRLQGFDLASLQHAPVIAKPFCFVLFPWNCGWVVSFDSRALDLSMNVVSFSLSFFAWLLLECVSLIVSFIGHSIRFVFVADKFGASSFCFCFVFRFV